MYKVIKKIDDNKIEFDELSKVNALLTEQLETYKSKYSSELKKLTELQKHKEYLQNEIKNKDAEIITIKQELVGKEEQRYLIFENLTKIETLEEQEHILLKDFTEQYESLHLKLEQDKLQEITLQESLNESDDQRKSAND